MKKIIIIVLIILVSGYFLIDRYYIKNVWCKSEDGRYEIWGNSPVDITEKINNGECKCISESLIVEDKPKYFDKSQLQKIREELPKWAVSNIKEFSEKDKKELSLKLQNLSDTELQEELEYKYTFIDGRYLTCFVPVYVYSFGADKAYCPNYQCVYDDYKKLSSNPEGIKLLAGKKMPNYSIVESATWARNLGDKGI